MTDDRKPIVEAPWLGASPQEIDEQLEMKRQRMLKDAREFHMRLKAGDPEARQIAGSSIQEFIKARVAESQKGGE